MSTKNMQHLWKWMKKVKHKMVPVHAEKAYSTITCTVLSILKLSTRCKWVVTPCHSPLTPLKKSGWHMTGGWVGPSTSVNTLEKRKISCTCQKLKPRLSNPQTGHKLSCAGYGTKFIHKLQQCHKETQANFNLKLKTRFWMPLQHSNSKHGLTDTQAIVSVCEPQIKAANTTINTAAGNGSSGYKRKTADNENQRWQWIAVGKSQS